MSLTLTRLRYNLRQELGGLDSTDLDDTDTDELLNLAFWELENNFDFHVKTSRWSATLVADQAEYSLSTITRLDAIQSVVIFDTGDDNDDKSHKLARMTRDWYDSHFVDDSDENDLPERYLREDDTLTLFPAPDDTYSIEVTLKQNLASLENGVVDTTGLPRNWDEIVLAGAVWRGHKRFGDYNLAQQAMNFQIGLIRQAVPVEAKEEEDSRYARLNVIHEFPEETLKGHED